MDSYLAVHSSLLGTALGDSIGLPFEGLSKQRVASLLKDRELGHRFFFGRGMLSDDTEHSLMVLRALARDSQDVSVFQRSLARYFRWWLAAVPAGVGLATARSIIRLWCGVAPQKSGVWSAGNGPAMRSAVIGAFFADDRERRVAFTKASCVITHSDPRAEEGALLVAEAASLAVRGVESSGVLAELKQLVQSDEMKARYEGMEEMLSEQASVSEFAQRIGDGKRVTGFAPDTVAVAIYAWLRHRFDFRRVITEVIRCGGDTDTVAAVAGGIAGAELEVSQFPEQWLDGLSDFPYTQTYMEKMVEALSEERRAPRLCWPIFPLRNVGFLLIVLSHGFRRLLPPY